MGKYILKRVVMALLTVWAIITITFFLMHAIPGDPFSNEGNKMPKIVYENLVKQYGLDKPLPEQYLIYLSNVVRFDFGRSMKSDVETVNQMIKRGFSVFAGLGLQALALVFIVGPLLGILVAINQNKLPDYIATIIAIIDAGGHPSGRARQGWGPESTPWVAATMTSLAPESSSTWTALAIVPPVSIMSSTRTQKRPSTSPTTRLATDSLGREMSRVLWTKASGVPPSWLA